MATKNSSTTLNDKLDEMSFELFELSSLAMDALALLNKSLPDTCDVFGTKGVLKIIGEKTYALANNADEASIICYSLESPVLS